MKNNNNQKQASDFDNFAYNIAPQFEDGFYGYAVDKDFSMSIVQMYLDCETEEDEKKVDRALRKLRNFHLSMDRGHLKNKAKYSGEEMFKESNFKEYVKRQTEKYPPKEEEKTEDVKTDKETRPTRMTKTENVVMKEEPPIAEALDKNEKEMNEKMQEVVANNIEYEKSIAMKRLAGLTGLKRAAMAATIEKYFNDKQTAENMYRDDPNIHFAYTLDDYINGARYNIGS